MKGQLEEKQGAGQLVVRTGTYKFTEYPESQKWFEQVQVRTLLISKSYCELPNASLQRIPFQYWVPFQIRRNNYSQSFSLRE